MAGLFEGSKVAIMAGGRVLGEREIKSINADCAYEVEPVPIRPALSGSFSILGGFTEAGRKWLADLASLAPTYDVTVRDEFPTEPRKLRSKKKRLRKKWANKYPNQVVEKSFKNVRIEGL